MLRTILVPVDGSPLAEQAVSCAERLAAATSARLLVSRVIPVAVTRPEDDLGLAADARAALERTAEQLAARGRAVQTSLQWGDPAACILDQARSSQVDLVVMGTHGRSMMSTVSGDVMAARTSSQA